MIGELFGKAWELWKRDVAWLILAGLVAGVIVVGIAAIGVGILAASVASALMEGIVGRRHRADR